MYAYYGTNMVWVPLKASSVQRLACSDNLHPWRNQYLPSVPMGFLSTRISGQSARELQLALRLTW